MIRKKKVNKENCFVGNRGFAAFILVISISTLMLAFTFMSSVSIGHFFDEVTRKEYRLMSYYAGYSCIDQALLAISHDYFIKINKSINFPDLFCEIDSIMDSGSEKIIKVHGDYKGLIEYRQATARVYDNRVEIVSLE